MKQEIKKEMIPTEEVKKTKKKGNKIDKEKLKMYVFEKLSFGWTQQEIADETGYSRAHINDLSQEIQEEYIKEIKKDKNKLIVKELQRLEGITRKLYKELEKLDGNKNINKMVLLHSEILKTNELLMKLQGLIIDKVQINNDLTKEEIDEFNELFE